MPSVLVVDDEPGLLRLFSELVARLGVTTLQASGGIRAIELLRKETPDLMILDLAMPEVSGQDVLEYVRTQPRLDRMKIMILTARPYMVPEVEALGIDRWVSKPVMPMEFLDHVRDLLAEQGDEQVQTS
jgi:CheY-like chemotaxis protein